MLLDCLDPRLSLIRRPAASGDALVPLVLPLLADALLAPGPMTAVAAPQLGLPVLVLAYRSNDMISYLFDPEIEKLEDLTLVRGEPQPHCRGMARDVWRAGRVTLQGRSLAGPPQRVSFAGAEASSVQQAMDFCGQGPPFLWMTPFHRAWAAARVPAESNRAAAISGGLYGAPEPALAPPGAGLVALGPDLRGVLWNGQQLAVIDAANPLRPVAVGDRLLLAGLLAFSGCRSVCFDSPWQFPVALGLLAWGRMNRMIVPRDAWPVQAQNRLGLDSLIQILGSRLPAGLGELPNELDAIVLDRRAPDAAALTDADLAAMARRLSGYHGALLVQTAGPDPALEARLLAHYEALVLLGGASGPQVLVARKTRQEMEGLWPFVVQQARAHGMEDVLTLLRSQALLLRKDGKRVPL